MKEKDEYERKEMERKKNSDSSPIEYEEFVMKTL